MHRTPLLFELALLPVVQPLGLGLEPGVDLVFRPETLVNVARLIDEVQHDAVLDALAELVGVDVATEHFLTGARVLLEQGRAGEADEYRIRHHRLHHPVQLAALRAVALVHEHKHFPHGEAGPGLQLLDIGVEVVHVLGAELVYQRTQQARRRLTELGHQVAAAFASGNDGIRTREHALNLLVQLVTVGDDGDTGIGIVLQNPLGQQHHHDALAASLRVPDDAALLLPHVCLRRLDAEILVRPR